MSKQTKPKPSKDRINRLKMMKRKKPATASSNPVLMPAAKQHRNIVLPEQFHWDKTTTEIISRKRGRFKKVQLLNPDEDNYMKKKAPSFTLCEFVTHGYCYLTGEGNLGKPTGKKDQNGQPIVFGPKTAKFIGNFAQGCPAKCEDLSQYKNLATRQENCMNWVKAQAVEMLRFAYHDDEMWPEFKKELDLSEDEFIKGALLAFSKTDHGEDDEEVPFLQLKRKLMDYDGNNNVPRYWKMNTEGTFEIFHPDYIPRGSLLIPTAQFMSYCFRGKDKKIIWGVSLTMERDIIVVCLGEGKSEEQQAKETEERRQNGVAQAMSDVPCLF